MHRIQRKCYAAVGLRLGTKGRQHERDKPGRLFGGDGRCDRGELDRGAELWSRVPITELHDDDPNVRWYTTPGVPFPPLQPRLLDEASARGYRRQERAGPPALRGAPGSLLVGGRSLQPPVGFG